MKHIRTSRTLKNTIPIGEMEWK